MNDPRPPLHQPPNPDDLRRAPPAGPECARVRGLLRDFADGDLVRAEHRLVEEHVHACFACSVELSRAEHEVLRLKRGFASVAASRALQARGLPADFAQRLIDRIVDGSSVDGSRSDGAPAGRRVDRAEADDFAAEDAGLGGARVARGGSRQWGGQRGGARHPAIGARSLRLRPTVLLACAAMVLACFGALAMWSLGAEREPDLSARLVVMSAKGAFGDAGRRLGIGDGLGEAQWLQVGAGGNAKFDWHDLSSNSQPAATLEMSGKGQLRLQKGAPLLLNGSVAIDTNRPVDIPVADGSHIQLGIGDYVIVAESPLLGDDYLAQLRDPMSSAPADLRIRVEVLRGDSAQIVRTEVGPTLVAAGSVGVYGGSSDVSVSPSGSQVAVAGGVQRGGPGVGSPTPLAPTLSASVYQRSGLPSVGTQVAAVYAANGATSLRVGVTNAYGSVVMNSDAPCDSEFAVLRAVPAQLEYGVVAPDAFPLVRDGVHMRTQQDLVLDLAEPLHGTVVDDSGNARLGVRVLPCIVDELFDDVFAINADFDYVVTDEQGRFQVRRLPAALPHYQHLVLVLAHPELAPAVVPVPVRGGANALLPMAPIVMKGLTTVALHWLPIHSTVTIWEEVPVLPLGRAIWRRVFEADGEGKVLAAAVGGGQMWWAVGGANEAIVHRMTADGTDAMPRFRPIHEVGVPQSVHFRSMQNVGGTDLFLASSFRHHRFDLPATGGSASSFTMVARDTLNRPVAHAQVFAVASTGPRGSVDARFLGLTSAQGVISLEPVRYEGDLVVVGPDGSLALASAPQQSFPRLDTRLAPTGRVLLAPSLRPDVATGQTVVSLRFRRLFSGLSGIGITSVRFASEATGWEFAGLAPGFYSVEVNGQNRQLEVFEDGFTTLQ
jgi:hypothetical protein